MSGLKTPRQETDSQADTIPGDLFASSNEQEGHNDGGESSSIPTPKRRLELENEMDDDVDEASEAKKAQERAAQILKDYEDAKVLREQKKNKAGASK